MRAHAVRRALRVALLVAFAVVSCACKRKHIAVGAVPELGYPVCGDAGADDLGVIMARGHIRSGPWSQEQRVVERFELHRTACGYTFRTRQEWPLAVSDVEVRYDPELAPLWAWKRMTIPGSMREDGNAEFRLYELRTGHVFIKRRDASGVVTREELLPGGRVPVPEGAHVGAVVGPGRGVLTAWIKRAKLPVGGKARELVLDFRDALESLEMATLERSEDLFDRSFGKSVRVYTFFGRETVFTDDDDTVIGDLAGMRPNQLLQSPEPEPMPTYGEPSPWRSF
jgi:hypothetical protein